MSTVAPSRKKTPKNRKSKSGRNISRQFDFFVEGLSFMGGGLKAFFSFCISFLVKLYGSLRKGFYGDSARQPIGIALACASLFVFGALLSFQEGAEEDNWCGFLGYSIASSALFLLGLGAFVAPIFGTFWGVARLIREERSGYAGFKLAGTALLTLGVAFLGHVWGDQTPTNTFFNGQGGWVSTVSLPILKNVFGPLGVGLIIFLLNFLALLMATEWAFVPLMRELLSKSAKRFKQHDLPWGEKKKTKTIQRGWLRQSFSWLGHQFSGFDVQTEVHIDKASESDRHRKPIQVTGTGIDDMDTKPAESEPVEENVSSAEELVFDAETEEESEEASSSVRPIDDEEYALPSLTLEEQSSARIDSEEELEIITPRKTPTLDSMPSIELCERQENTFSDEGREELNKLGRQLQKVLDSFDLKGEVTRAERGPTITMFAIALQEGVSVKKINAQMPDIGISLGTDKVRLVYPLPGTNEVGIEVPNREQASVRFRNVFETCQEEIKKSRLPMVLGKASLGEDLVADLAKMPHMLIAGTTGSGKSVSLNCILISILLTRSPEQVRLILIDPKQVELDTYSDIPHLLCPVVSDMKRAAFTLNWTVQQMEERLHTFRRAKVRNLEDYNKVGREGLQNLLGEMYDEVDFPDSFPYIVVVIDELADLMLQDKKGVETSINRIAAKARAAGIHLIVATQRPSTDVVTGLIKANLPVRMSFRVNTQIDSRVILDGGGGEKLLGNGDFLYRPPGSDSQVRGQGAFIDTPEVMAVCNFLREHGRPEYFEDLAQGKDVGGGDQVDDPLFKEAVEYVLTSGRGSASLLQRKYSIGYTRASRLVDYMTEFGILGTYNGSKPREILVTLEEWQESIKN